MRSRTLLTIPVAIAMACLAVGEALAAKKVLRMKFDGPMLESPSPDGDLAVLMGGEKSRTLRDWLVEIDSAAKDKEIAGIAMIIEQPSMSLAQVEEITRALKRFRETGKKVLCYTDYASNSTFALACAADFIMLAENSDVEIPGLHAELSFYKGLFDKIGIEADMLHCGAYKSALEPYTRTEPSKEAAENVNWLLDGIYGRWMQLLADGRKLPIEKVRELVDAALINDDEAVKGKLVDATGSFVDFKQLIQKEFGTDATVVKSYKKEDGIELDPDNPFAIFQVFSDMMEKANEKSTKAGIGLIYVDGAIVTGKSTADFMSGTSAGSTTIRAALDRAADDPNIKAVVLRVDSPGGSALASDIIWKAATRCAKTKPLIVSMGRVAGSGGYYVAIPGDQIFAEETTITGSIGVVGGKMVLKGLFEEKLGITTTEFTRGKNAGLMSSNRRWTEDERAKMSAYMTDVYDQFKERVTVSRGDRIKGKLEDLAGGRVFTGRQALEKGLVDRIGGLNEAMTFAAEKVGLKEYEVYTLPRPADLGEILKKLMGQPTEDEYELDRASAATHPAISLADSTDPLLRAAAPLLAELAPEKARSIVAMLKQVATMNEEHVSCFMPMEIQLR